MRWAVTSHIATSRKIRERCALHLCCVHSFVSIYAEDDPQPLYHVGALRAPVLLQAEEDHYGVCNQIRTEWERKCVQQVQCFGPTKGLSLHHQP